MLFYAYSKQRCIHFLGIKRFLCAGFLNQLQTDPFLNRTEGGYPSLGPSLSVPLKKDAFIKAVLHNNFEQINLVVLPFHIFLQICCRANLRLPAVARLRLNETEPDGKSEPAEQPPCIGPGPAELPSN